MREDWNVRHAAILRHWEECEQDDYLRVRELSRTLVKRTRTTHSCVICRSPIPIGSRAERVVSITEGTFTVEWFHDGALWDGCPERQQS